MEMSLGDRLGFVEKLSRVATSLSGGGYNILASKKDIGCSYVKVWLGTEGDNACR